MALLRIEHRGDGKATPISRDLVLLTPILHQLEAGGVAGELLVIDEVSGRVVTRCPLGRAPEEGDAVHTIPAARHRA